MFPLVGPSFFLAYPFPQCSNPCPCTTLEGEERRGASNLHHSRASARHTLLSPGRKTPPRRTEGTPAACSVSKVALHDSLLEPCGGASKQSQDSGFSLGQLGGKLLKQHEESPSGNPFECLEIFKNFMVQKGKSNRTFYIAFKFRTSHHGDRFTLVN